MNTIKPTREGSGKRPTEYRTNRIATVKMRPRPSASARFLVIMAFAFGLGLARTQAAIYTFNLHGLVDNGFTETYGGDPYLYELWQDPIYDLRQFSASAGDVLDITITLDQSHTIPGSMPDTLLFINIYFFGYSYPNVNSSSSTTASLFNQGALVFSTTDPTSSSTSGGALSTGILFYAANNAPITFDQVHFHSVVTDTQGSVLNFSLAELSTTRIIPVPEPNCLSMLAAALSGVTLAQWKRKSLYFWRKFYEIRLNVFQPISN